MRLLKEYIANYDLGDGSSITHGYIIGIDDTILQKVLYLSTRKFAIGVEVSSNFSLRSFFKGRMTSFEKS